MNPPPAHVVAIPEFTVYMAQGEGDLDQTKKQCIVNLAVFPSILPALYRLSTQFAVEPHPCEWSSESQ